MMRCGIKGETVESSAITPEGLLDRARNLECQPEYLKRDLLRCVAVEPGAQGASPSLFGSVQAGDMTEEEIEQEKRQVLRYITDI